ELDVAADVEAVVQRRVLQQDADGVARGQLRLTVGRRVETGHDLEHGRLSGAVGTDDTDLRAGQERQRDIVEDDLVADGFAHAAHRVDVLRHAVQTTDGSRGG